MADYENDRWNNDNRWAGEADYGQDRDRQRGYREGRYADDYRHNRGYERAYGERHRSHPLRGAPPVNQDIGYGSGSLATGVGVPTRAPGSFSDYGAGSNGSYGDGYGAYGGPTDRAAPQTRGYQDTDSRGYRRTDAGYRADDRYDGRFGESGAFAVDPILDRQARGEDRSFFSRDRHDEGQHRGRGPKNYKRSEERIRDDVNDRLTDDSWLDAQHIDVEVKDRDVTLSGTVRSREDKRRAEVLAEHVSGVDHVQNNLRVKRDEADDAADVTPLPLI